MRGEDQRGFALEELGESGKRPADAKVIGDGPALERDVQVGADEDPLPGDVAEIVERGQAHSEAATISTSSTSRFEYPHSLSYQPITLTRLPMTIVDWASNVQDAGLPTTSLDTIGSSV